jgi:hypothetical protein
MDTENKQMEASRRDEVDQATGMPELSAETIEAQITSELAKVVGIDQDRLEQYVSFLGTMPAEDVAALLQKLKEDLGEQLLPLLERMAHHAQKTLAEIGIEKLGAIQSFKAAQLLSELNDSHPDKTLRKAARKSLYRLRSAGIEVETSHKPLLGESKHTRYKTLMSAVDGSGAQLIIFSEEMLAGDLQLLQVLANDEKGVTECYSRRGITKKMFAKLPETFASQTGGASPMFVEADLDYSMSLVLEAERLNASTDQLLPDEYVSMKEFFGLDQAQPIDNPVYKVLDAANLKNQPYFLRTSEELFKNEMFLSWLLPINETGQYAQEVLDQDDTVLELSPQFQKSARKRCIKK